MASEFIGTCVGLKAEDIHAYDDTEKEIGYRTFRKHVGKAVVAELNAAFDVPLHKDWHVRFGKGTWKGRACMCLHHSGIHHLWHL